MRFKLFILLMLFGLCGSYAQQYFPVKIEKKWGLIDVDGQVVLPPQYDAIGEFKNFGYAVMQRNGLVGLLGPGGRELLPPRYDDLKVLDSTLVAVMDLGEWMVIDLTGRIVLQKGYDRVHVWDGQYLAFLKNGLWGIVDRNGRVIAKPEFDEIDFEQHRFFVTWKGETAGLLSEIGLEILPPIAEEIRIYSDSLFFYRSGGLWGAVDDWGVNLIPASFDSYKKVADNFLKLVAGDSLHIYSISCKKVITQGEYDEYYPFSRRLVIVKNDRKLGLLDQCGELILSPRYDEIQAYRGDLFRVNIRGKWGVVGAGDQQVIPFDYDYIAPIRNNICVVKKKGRFGIVNYKGEEVVEPVFNRIALEEQRVKAYIKRAENPGEESLTILNFDDEGQLVDNNLFEKHFHIKIAGKKGGKKNGHDSGNETDYVLDKFEWFYSPAEDRWGLRRLEDGSIQIEPKFHYIHVEKELGFTLVGIENFGNYEFERTTYRFEMTHGLVNNEIGLLITDLDFWDVRFEDFHKGLPLARCVFSNGRHGLVDRIGRIVRKDFAFIGDFHEGVSRMSVRGRISGSMKDQRGLGKLKDYLSELASANYRVDYTKYDQLFQEEAVLVCENCEWGYIDTAGQVLTPPKYSFAKDFVNGVGIVEHDGKWGMINRKNDTLIPCKYDGIDFLENTNNRIVRVYIQEPKYGLVDTLGQLTVGAMYDEIGLFSEGRLAVKRSGMWGFVNSDGLEVIPCRFREVMDFSEGLAAVKLGRSWGFIDKQGNVEIDFKYRRAGNFKDGLAWVFSDEGVGYINRKNEFVIEPQFEKAYDFHRGVARVVVKNKYALIDQRGRFLIRPRYSDIQPFDHHGLAIVRYGNDNIRYGLINLKGELITSIHFRQIDVFNEGLAAVKDKDGYGFIDTSGKVVIPCIYSKVSNFSEGRAAVQKDGSCGYINRTGTGVVSFEFSKCLDFDGGKAVVYRGIRRAGLVDMEGRLIIEPSIDRLLQFREGRGLVRDDQYRFYYITEKAGLYNGYYQRATSFQHGVAVVQIDDKWGVINQRGIEIIPPKYGKIESFKDGYAKVRIEGFNGLSNLEGELIVQPDFEFISYAGQGIFRVEKGDKIGYFDIEGRWVWDLNN
jgi:hypothetical protein